MHLDKTLKATVSLNKLGSYALEIAWIDVFNQTPKGKQGSVFLDLAKD